MTPVSPPPPPPPPHHHSLWPTTCPLLWRFLLYKLHDTYLSPNFRFNRNRMQWCTFLNKFRIICSLANRTGSYILLYITPHRLPIVPFCYFLLSPIPAKMPSCTHKYKTTTYYLENKPYSRNRTIHCLSECLILIRKAEHHAKVTQIEFYYSFCKY